MAETDNATSNKILDCLEPETLEILNPLLERVELPIRTQLERAYQEVRYAYFLLDGFASVIANGVGGRAIEVAMIGREGVTAIPVIMGSDRSPHETHMQSYGTAMRITSTNLRKAMEQSPEFRMCVLNFCNVYLVQISQNCLAHGRSKLDERLARWLLMAHDRSPSDELVVTHEHLAYILGVRRPGVSIALKQLEQRGLVNNRRGSVVVVNRSGLEQLSNGSYGVPEAEFAWLFGAEK